MFKVFLLPFLLCVSLFAPSLQAQQSSVLDSLLKPNDQFLPVEQAFVFDFVQRDNELVVSWTIADGYYLYKDKIKLGGIAVSFSHPSYPASMTIEDEFFGVTDVYFHQLTLRIPLTDVSDDAIFKLQYMGCAEAGLCYPPVTKELPLSALKAVDTSDSNSQSSTPVSSQNTLAAKLSDGASLATLAGFFLLGLGLAFTPCVFPMYPILTSIIVGQGKQLSNKRAFTLSFSYVQGMAITYSLLGLIIASLGVKFQGYMQHPAVLIVASIIFVLLALAMFGVFNLSLPSSWQEKISNVSNKQQGGSHKGAFTMGALSGLIASPCTTAPLSAALLYVAQSGDLLLGAITLYILSLGMGLPLLLLGSSGGKLLPKAGNWMNAVKTSFGFLLLAVPLILLERILPFSYVLAAGSLLMLCFVVYLYRTMFSLHSAAAKAVVLVAGQLLLLAVLLVNIRFWWPATDASVAIAEATGQQTGFELVNSLEELQQKIAASDQRYTLVDLYADWCIACKEFEHLTFPKAEVQAQMQKMQLIKVDVTKMTRKDQALLDNYQVLGLPTLLFFSPQGEELSSARVTGFMNATDFAAHLQQLQR
ncbi:MAG: protein-disulfide reductase DsbD [Gammaproteobacteria bacterium]|nr:protein-disulfide reductase DsbD [Gammaproteobacteria bacterium]MBU1555645.1 protein-disulfide reductase DsbD [Gammaproteobacteria bacterium]MBU2068729.1 protein-disulfide reductase DsbD [Gammaproteobacteria bacterium]MBU2185176.1 protein-disulfide reductase DsbD [Gammaproteobacteria bacterium]MBU2205408.1 protein-disulfide reductase DsbD [Gammaproteobacteria bacterium]